MNHKLKSIKLLEKKENLKDLGLGKSFFLNFTPKAQSIKGKIDQNVKPFAL